MEIIKKESDEKMLDLLADTQKQYENYLKVTSSLDVLLEEDAIIEPTRSWDHPLTLVLNKDK